MRDVFVAETDAQAKKYAIEGALGHAWEEYLLPTYKRFGILHGMLKDPDMNPDEIDLEYLAEHVWLVGSVDTVVDKFQSWFEEIGGFGTIIQYSHDYADNPQPWVESMNLLAQEVAPRVKMPASAGRLSERGTTWTFFEDYYHYDTPIGADGTPYEYYEAFRDWAVEQDQDLGWSEKEGGFWLVTGYDAGKEIFQNPQVFTNRESTFPVYKTPDGRPLMVAAYDEPEHKKYRSLIQGPFSPKAAHEMAESCGARRTT